MYYKNISLSVKTFHGVTFQPGEVKQVSKFINHPKMIIVDKPVEPKKKPSEPTKNSDTSTESKVKPNNTKEENSDG